MIITSNFYRINMWIIIILLNFIILFTILYKEKHIKLYFILSLVILFLILVCNIKMGYDRVKKITLERNSSLKYTLLIKNFFYDLHLSFVFGSFLYINFYIYLFVLICSGKIGTKFKNIIIILSTLGLFFIVKELILQFSQCLYSGFCDEYRNRDHFNKHCKKEYDAYWQCILN